MVRSWKEERKRDIFYREAKKRGYRARSAFKLIDIQKRFKVIRKGDIVLDLGAAPGSWCQVTSEIVGSQGRVIGIDLVNIKPIDGVTFIRGDVTEKSTKDRLRKILGEKKLDVVLSDLSPKLSGIKTLDHARSMWLAECAFGYAKDFLKRGGNFVCKVFEGEDLDKFRRNLRSFFSTVRCYNPRASRKYSSEIYIIAKTFKQKNI